jgi:hypothetical protein
MSKKREQVKNAIKKVMLKCGWKSVEDLTNAVMDVIEPKYPRVFRDKNSRGVCIFDGPDSEAKTYRDARLEAFPCSQPIQWHEEIDETEELFGTEREEALRKIEEANKPKPKWPRVFMGRHYIWVCHEEHTTSSYCKNSHKLQLKYDPNTVESLEQCGIEIYGKVREEVLKKIEEANSDDVEVTVEGKTTRISRKSALALNLIKE